MPEPTPPTAGELHARLTAFEQRTADLEAVLVGLVMSHRNGDLSERARNAWRHLRDEG
jgi:hypothetical protein